MREQNREFQRPKGLQRLAALILQRALLGGAMLLLVMGLMPQALAQETLVTGSVDALEARALVRSSTRIDFRTDIVAAVKAAPFKAGDRFKQGDLLIAFDCSRYEAELNAAKASANAAYIETRTKKRLFKHGAAGKDEVSQAAAQSAKAAAELKAHRARNKACRIEAPFDGRVVDLQANVHEYPASDLPLMTIIDDRSLELEMVVPSKWLIWLEPGHQFHFTVDETGVTLPASVESLGAEVDPVSQTIKIIGRLSGNSNGVLAGMSGTAVFYGGAG